MLPLSTIADAWLAELARATNTAPLADLDGVTLLAERAVLANLRIPGPHCSAGGGCLLCAAQGGAVALNLARAEDRDLLPALFETAALDPSSDNQIRALIAEADPLSLIARGRAMGLAIAAEQEPAPCQPPCVRIAAGAPSPGHVAKSPRVLDLSALWAGPLAAHLLWQAGADVIKVESRTRPDAMRQGDPAFHALLNQGKASVVLDLTAADGRHALLSLVARADIVIEASRPRALAQLGIDADALVRTTPGLLWMSITAHGASGEPANWVGFGDDCGVAGGLTAALRAATGAPGFVGDAIADPLTGIFTALTAWTLWHSDQGGRYGLSMSAIAALALAQARAADPAGLAASLTSWRQAAGKPFPPVRRRPAGTLPAWGADTRACLADIAPC